MRPLREPRGVQPRLRHSLQGHCQPPPAQLWLHPLAPPRQLLAIPSKQTPFRWRCRHLPAKRGRRLHPPCSQLQDTSPSEMKLRSLSSDYGLRVGKLALHVSLWRPVQCCTVALQMSRRCSSSDLCSAVGGQQERDKLCHFQDCLWRPYPCLCELLESV